jgi:predicted RNA-binding Zn ribbon-like protein
MQLTVWKFVGGRVCLDFVNTVGGRVRGVVVRDRLRGYEDLLAWSEAAGLITESEARILARRATPRTTKAIASRAMALRQAIYLLFRPRRDVPALDRMLWPLAHSAAELLASSERARVRLCEGEDCGWLFLDTSRNGARHWCDMKDCGNRAKVRRFRERQRVADDPRRRAGS